MPWKQTGDGLMLTVRLTPKAARDTLDRIEVLADGRAALKAYVRAVPEKGGANAALVKLISKTLKLPKSAVSLETGATARLKTLRLEGNAAELSGRLTEIVSGKS
ncbi:DUF167 family protein [Roseibium polysiphoniae]|nr:DUF167 family protein [Roseibium polysiphoniae]